MIYSDKIKEAVRKIEVPVTHAGRFQMDIVAFEAEPPFLMLRFYENQWLKLHEYERERCAIYMLNVQQTIALHGVKATLDPVKGSRPS